MKNVVKRVACTIALIMLCAGCGNKEAKTTSDFTVFAEEQQFTVSDCTEQFADYGYIEQALVAVSPESTYQIEFYVLDSEESACVFYQESYEILSENEKDAKSHVNTSTETVQNYEITGTEGYACVTRIGNTCFYAVVDKEYKEAVKDFKESYGY